MRRWTIPVVLLAVAGCTSSPGTTVPAATAKAVGGPSARRLARGHWSRMPVVPIRLCNPQAIWDGRDLVLIEPGYPPCRPAAAAYDPKTNTWTVIAAPPRAVGAVPLGAFGGGRLVLVSPITGATYIWNAATGLWRRVDSLPLKDAASVSWTGSYFLVITTRRTGVNGAALLAGAATRLGRDGGDSGIPRRDVRTRGHRGSPHQPERLLRP